jgi:hypothetical protein
VHSRLELEKETLVCQCHQSIIFFNYGERMLNKSNGGKKKKKENKEANCFHESTKCFCKACHKYHSIIKWVVKKIV